MDLEMQNDGITLINKANVMVTKTIQGFGDDIFFEPVMVRRFVLNFT